MGYYTDFCLEVTDAKGHSADELDAAIAEMNDAFEFDEFISDDSVYRWENPSDTWYDHEKDMAALSAQFPDVLFTLNGAGENVDDRWQKYFKRGLIQRTQVRVIFDEFDETKLGPLQEGGESE